MKKPTNKPAQKNRPPKPMSRAGKVCLASAFLAAGLAGVRVYRTKLIETAAEAPGYQWERELADSN
jgi:hypothetical protein